MENWNWRKSAATIVIASGAFISALFGFEGVKLEAYKDPVGVVTIGAGHTGKDVKMGDKITRKQAEQLAVKDINKHWDAIKPYIKVPVSQNEAEAFADLAYNIGAANFRKSTLLKKLNAGDYPGACRAIKSWVYAKGKKLPGLVKRREAEYQRCMGGEWKQAANDAVYYFVGVA